MAAAVRKYENCYQKDPWDCMLHLRTRTLPQHHACNFAKGGSRAKPWFGVKVSSVEWWNEALRNRISGRHAESQPRFVPPPKHEWSSFNATSYIYNRLSIVSQQGYSYSTATTSRDNTTHSLSSACSCSANPDEEPQG